MPAPVFTSPAAFNITENLTAVGTVVARQSGGGAHISYSLDEGVDDTDLFTVHATTGALAFIDAPDFEDPTDGDTDNVYLVNVIALDTDNSEIETQAISVTVKNAIEAGEGNSTWPEVTFPRSTYPDPLWPPALWPPVYRS